MFCWLYGHGCKYIVLFCTLAESWLWCFYFFSLPSSNSSCLMLVALVLFVLLLRSTCIASSSLLRVIADTGSRGCVFMLNFDMKLRLVKKIEPA